LACGHQVKLAIVIEIGDRDIRSIRRCRISLRGSEGAIAYSQQYRNVWTEPITCHKIEIAISVQVRRPDENGVAIHVVRNSGLKRPIPVSEQNEYLPGRVTCNREI